MTSMPVPRPPAISISETVKSEKKVEKKARPKKRAVVETREYVLPEHLFHKPLAGHDALMALKAKLPEGPKGR